MDSGTFWYLIGLAVHLSLQIQLLDVITAYLHGPLETRLYIKPLLLFSDTKLPPPQPRQFSGLRIQKVLYGLKQAGRLWYKHLRKFLLDHKFTNDATLPYIFVYKQRLDFVILAVYVDDINLMGTLSACHYAVTHLQSRFDMKLLSCTSLCLRLQISHLSDSSMFLHQTANIRRILKRFQMHDAWPLP